MAETLSIPPNAVANVQRVTDVRDYLSSHLDRFYGQEIRSLQLSPSFYRVNWFNTKTGRVDKSMVYKVTQTSNGIEIEDHTR